MIASVKTLVSSIFVKYPPDDIDIDAINEIFASIEKSFNKIIKKIQDRGLTMDDMELERIDNITQVVSKLNSNIDTINKYISSLNSTFGENYLLQKEILETMSIDVVNSDSTAVVTVFDDRLNIAMANGQIVDVSAGKVVSTKDGDEQTIIHA